jgi:hypothetical protein
MSIKFALNYINLIKNFDLAATKILNYIVKAQQLAAIYILENSIFLINHCLPEPKNNLKEPPS